MILFPKPRPRQKRTPGPVPPGVREIVLARDGGCVARRLDPDAGPCAGRVTLDHVRDEPRMAKRAPSDPRHLVSVCVFHHVESGWATSHRPLLREYLRSLGGSPDG